MKTSEKWLRTQKHPAWLDKAIGTEHIDEGSREILMFYLTFSVLFVFGIMGHHAA